jgi:hypothetical protein
MRKSPKGAATTEMTISVAGASVTSRTPEYVHASTDPA